MNVPARITVATPAWAEHPNPRMGYLTLAEDMTTTHAKNNAGRRVGLGIIQRRNAH